MSAAPITPLRDQLEASTWVRHRLREQREAAA
jgi:hypothetical protein